jgi:tol-pal system protein YbgF
LRRKTAVAAGTLALAGWTLGCVLPDQFAQVQTDVAAWQAKLQALQQAQEAQSAKLDQIASAVSSEEEQGQVGRAEFADLKLQLEELGRQQAMLDERLIEANRRVERLSQSVEETRGMVRTLAVAGSPSPGPGGVPESTAAVGAEGAAPAPGGPPSAASGALPSADDLYHTAYADFSKGNYAIAISGFEEYATRYPESDRADNALYWIGECYFSQGDYVVAVEAFDRMLGAYPESDRAAAANLKKGLAYLEQAQTRPAIIQLQYVQKEFPDSDEARVAREKLASLSGR